MTLDLDACRERYIAERPRYEELAGAIEAGAVRLAREERAPARSEGRSKEVPSLLKKLLKRQDDPGAYEAIGDKAGARLTFRYRSDVLRVADAAERAFDIVRREDKAAELQFSELGYLGIHLDVVVGAKTRAYLGEDVTHLSGLKCELQLRTNAESAWAEVSHDLLYKAVTDIPGAVKRAIYRLVALVEVFDESVANAQETIVGSPTYAPAAVIGALDEAFSEFRTCEFDRELSWLVVTTLIPLYDIPSEAIVSCRIVPFVQANSEKVAGIVEGYRGDVRANLFLTQPEVLMLFERLEADRFRLREVWPAVLPAELLEGLAEIWGNPY